MSSPTKLSCLRCQYYVRGFGLRSPLCREPRIGKAMTISIYFPFSQGCKRQVITDLTARAWGIDISNRKVLPSENKPQSG